MYASFSPPYYPYPLKGIFAVARKALLGVWGHVEKGNKGNIETVTFYRGFFFFS